MNERTIYTIDELINRLQRIRRTYGGDIEVIPYDINTDMDFEFAGLEMITGDMTNDDYLVGKLGMFLVY